MARFDTLRLAAVAAAALCLPARAEGLPKSLAGAATVIDGDTIEIGGDRVRLGGFDTPEEGKWCGTVNVYDASALALSDLVAGQTVRCEVTGKDRYGRYIGTCRAGGAELGQQMVATGWGRDWPRFSQGAYAEAEAAAREAGAGLWGLACPGSTWSGRTYD